MKKIQKDKLLIDGFFSLTRQVSALWARKLINRKSAYCFGAKNSNTANGGATRNKNASDKNINASGRNTKNNGAIDGGNGNGGANANANKGGGGGAGKNNFGKNKLPLPARPH